tara:strand:- start:46 stop:753 length:708 start_codon:yes stop_codon:yes gene_type:complete
MDNFEIRELGFSDDGEDLKTKRTFNMNSNLNEITTARQLKNGTRMFKCIQTGDLYASYSSGYVRRKAINSNMFYQLNKKNVSKVFNKQLNRAFNNTKRIMIESEQDRLNLINQRTLNIKPTQQKEEVMPSTNVTTNARQVVTKSRSFTGSRKNLKWPSYIMQVVHSSMMLNETPNMIANRLDQMLTDIPGHRFKFGSQQEKVEAIHNVMQHLQSRARQSVDRMIDHIDNVDRSKG